MSFIMQNRTVALTASSDIKLFLLSSWLSLLLSDAKEMVQVDQTLSLVEKAPFSSETSRRRATILHL